MDLSPAQSGTDDKTLSERIHPVVDQVVIRVPRAPRNGLAQSLQYRRLQLYIALLVMDALALVGAFALAGFVYDDGRGLYVAMMPAYLLLPLFQTIALYNAAYSQGSLEDWKRSLGRGVMALLISALLLNFFAFMTKSNEQFSRAIFALGFVGTIAGMAICRMMLDRFIRHMWGPNVLNSLLIEAGGPVVRIPHIYRVDAVEHALEPDLEDPVMLDRLARYIRNMDRVIVSCRPQDRVAWADILKCSGIHGEVISEYARQIGALGVVHHADAGVTGLLVSTGQLGMRSRAQKRLLDLTASMAALVILSPVMLLCAVAIKLEDGGPVFFRQRRMGRGNTFFDIYKFRSMREARADTAGSRSASKDDDRVTRVGRILRRTSLDELPQLINVMFGDMSTPAFRCVRLHRLHADAPICFRPGGGDGAALSRAQAGRRPAPYRARIIAAESRSRRLVLEFYAIGGAATDGAILRAGAFHNCRARQCLCGHMLPPRDRTTGFGFGHTGPYRPLLPGDHNGAGSQAVVIKRRLIVPKRDNALKRILTNMVNKRIPPIGNCVFPYRSRASD
jgi:hypothetical protein